MPQYRVYLFKGGQKSAARYLQADHDGAALRAALEHAHYFDHEIWDGGRLVKPLHSIFAYDS